MIDGGPTVEDCLKCALSRNRSRIVDGSGSKSAKIVFVGEAPGEQEDMRGVPFVGRAGKFLDSVLLKNGIEREKVFITNVVRCRPTNNRKPTEEEIEQCLPHLIDELKEIRPKVVLAMGAVAFRALTSSEGKLSDVVGKEIEICRDDIRIIVMPCFHPSAAIRNRKMRASFERCVSTAVASAGALTK